MLTGGGDGQWRPKSWPAAAVHRSAHGRALPAVERRREIDALDESWLGKARGGVGLLHRSLVAAESARAGSTPAAALGFSLGSGRRRRYAERGEGERHARESRATRRLRSLGFIGRRRKPRMAGGGSCCARTAGERKMGPGLAGLGLGVGLGLKRKGNGFMVIISRKIFQFKNKYRIS